MVFYAAGANRPELLAILVVRKVRAGVLLSYGDVRPDMPRAAAALKVIKIVGLARARACGSIIPDKKTWAGPRRSSAGPRT